MTDLAACLAFATETAFQAGRLTLGYYQRQLQVDRKADQSPVTIADREAEALIRQRLERFFPGHGIVGEEFGEMRPGATHRWFIDPIDGTKAFARGVPLYAVLIGLEIGGRIEVGAVYLPALDEMLSAATGLGAWWNGRAARVSEVRELSEATVCYTDIGNFARHNRAEAFTQLAERAYDRRGWSDAYGYVLVATGRAEVMLDPVMNPWDCAPFPVILREAGGYFGDWQGRESIQAGEALASNGALKEQVVAALASSPKLSS